RPGSCRGRARTPSRATDSSPLNVVVSARSTSSRVPAYDATPAPSAVTVIFGRMVVGCTSKVPLHQVQLGPQQAQSRLVKGHFRLSGNRHADRLVKSQG